jgi:DNA replication complex GINS protein SLD5 C-terminus
MNIMKRHLATTVTDHFPQAVWRSIDIPNDTSHEPNVQNQFVFVRCIEDVIIPDSVNHESNDGDAMIGNFSQRGQPQQAGNCLIVRYERIQQLMLQGKVELI